MILCLLPQIELLEGKKVASKFLFFFFIILFNWSACRKPQQIYNENIHQSDRNLLLRKKNRTCEILYVLWSKTCIAMLQLLSKISAAANNVIVRLFHIINTFTVKNSSDAFIPWKIKLLEFLCRNIDIMNNNDNIIMSFQSSSSMSSLFNKNIKLSTI